MANRTLTPEQRLYRAALRRYRHDYQDCTTTWTPDEQRPHACWYERTANWCATVAVEYSTTAERVAALLAVTSPQLSFDRNKSVTREVLDRYGNYGYLALSDLDGIGITTNRKTVALAILRGEPVPTTGRKVYSFYSNIRGIANIVTIDRHMVYPFTDERTSKASRIARWQYNALERAILTLAREQNVLPYHVQALLWAWYRRDSGWSKRDHLN